MHVQVRLTVVEIYCEKVRDLLDPLGRDNLAIKQGRDSGMYVEGAPRALLQRPPGRDLPVLATGAGAASERSALLHAWAWPYCAPLVQHAALRMHGHP